MTSMIFLQFITTYKISYSNTCNLRLVEPITTVFEVNNFYTIPLCSSILE